MTNVRHASSTRRFDSENQLVSARHSALTNGAASVLNSYGHKHRRTRKTIQRFHVAAVPTPMPPPDGEWITTETLAYVRDGNLPVHETVQQTSGSTEERSYFRGKDLSGTLQGAGGVGGLLYEESDGAIYIPCCDANGNVTRYLDATGTTVAQYAYDAFGNLLSATGPLADAFHHRFSTKYFDPETGLYYYGYRFYSPELMRWINRDPIEEDGGENLYAFVFNCPSWIIDPAGEAGCECFSIKMELVYTFTWDAWLTKKHEYPTQVQDGMTYPYSFLRRGKDRPHFQMFSPVEYVVSAHKIC